MKIVIDNAIPFIKGVMEPYADVLYREGGALCREDIKDADALIIRTRTRCDRDLLHDTAVKIIATTSSGYENINLEYCHENGIFVKNASGCNAAGVTDYVFSALYGCAARKSIPLTGATFGIIGVGETGSKVERMARMLGFKVLLFDPVRMEKEGSGQFCSLDTLLTNSDIVSLHLPLNSITEGLADSSFFSKMRLGAFFINTAHGRIVNENDLIEAVPKLGPVVIDAWANEPNVNLSLMEKVDIATPHVAGYSYQSKLTGTMMAVRTVSRFLGISRLFDFFPDADISQLEAVKLDVSGMSQGQIAAAFQYNYPIFTDDFIFRMNPSGFDEIRTNYRYRREFYID